MTMGCKAGKGATPAGAALPRRAQQPGSSRAAADRKSARAHRRKRRVVQGKAVAELVLADEERVCADQQQDVIMADDPDSCSPKQEETVQPLMSQAQGLAFTQLVCAAAAAALSCDSQQQGQQQATEALQSVGHISAAPLQPPAGDGMRPPGQEQEAAQDSQVTGSCMGGEGNRRLISAQRELAIRAVRLCHCQILCVPPWMM